MHKDDLKTGMLVQLRDMEICLVIGQTLLCSEDKHSFEWLGLNDYEDDLIFETTQHEFDIIKVSKVLPGHDLCFWTEETLQNNLLWSREDGFVDARTTNKPPRKEQFDIESNTWTETKKTS